ncbi:hypothetical protein HNQ01_000894 [Leptothrix sp. C29]|uniref:Uncharacterized protein n=1 Tax=Sphaerotilus uruguayifluvii TaxID=2735897 RepID=A0ABX2FZF7_9BURK|nr:hypothetical protein [Leptothrix sp. C29]
MLEAPRPAGHVTGKGCPTTDPSTRRQALDQPGAGQQRQRLDAENAPCEAFPAALASGTAGTRERKAENCSHGSACVRSDEGPSGTTLGTAGRIAGTTVLPRLAQGVGHRLTHQGAGPRPRPVRHRPASSASASTQKTHLAKPSRLLWHREHGNERPKIVRIGPHASDPTKGHREQHWEQSAGSREQPSSRCWRWAPATACSTRRQALDLDQLGAGRQQRQRLDVPAAGPAGPVAQPQPG